MAKLILIFLISFNAFSFSVISDLDETIKVTGRGLGSIYRVLAKTDIYLGMDVFFDELEEESLYVVTASPKQVSFRIWRLFNKNNIKVKGLYARNYFNGETKVEFKYNSIVDIFKKSDEKFILIGDNTSDDEEVYLQIKRDYPDRVLAVYIRVSKEEVSNNPDVRYFHHTADLALNELKDKRMKRSNVIKVLKPFLKFQSNFKYIFPRFAHCPQHESEFKTPDVFGFNLIVDKLNTALVNRCLNQNI